MEGAGKPVVIIGAGLGGLACAARLVSAGLPVIVVEASSRAGGRCGGYRIGDWTVDYFPHTFGRSSGSEIRQAGYYVGERIDFIIRNPFARVVIGPRDFALHPRLRSAPFFLQLLRRGGFQKKELPGISRHFWGLLHGLGHLPYSESVAASAYRYTSDSMYHRLLNLFSLLAFVIPYDRGSARELGQCIEGIRSGPGVGYPVGGCISIMDSLVRGIKKRGGHFYFNSPIRRCEVTKNTVSAVYIDNTRIEVSAVFSSIGIRNTATIVNRSSGNEQYFPGVDQLDESLGAITVRYYLQQKVTDYPVIMIFPELESEDLCSKIHSGRYAELGGLGSYVTIPSNFDASLAPPGHQLLVAGTLVPLVASDSLCHTLIAGQEKNLFDLFPDMEKVLIRREIQINNGVTGIKQSFLSPAAVGIAQSTTQTGPDRPNWRTSLENLFIVGADTGSGAIGTELATKSGLSVAGEYLQSLPSIHTESRGRTEKGIYSHRATGPRGFLF